MSAEHTTHACPQCGHVHLPRSEAKESAVLEKVEAIQWLCGDCQHPSTTHDWRGCRKAHCPCATRFGQSDPEPKPQPRGS